MAVEFKDYYTTLGVPRDASDDDIKKAFRKLARRCKGAGMTSIAL